MLMLVGLCASLAAFGQKSLLDTSFDPGAGAEGGFVEAVLVQPDGRVLVCGNFTSFNGQPQKYVARLEANGAVDSSFQSDVGYWVRSMALQPDGKIVIAGFFSDVSGASRRCVARLNPDGSLDTSFAPGTGCSGKIVPVDPTDPFVFAVGLQADGKIIITGNFTNYNGAFRSGIARLNSDGSLDATFDTGQGFNSWGRNLLTLDNGDVLVSGWFTTYNNQGANRMVRLNSSAAADPGFAPYFGDLTAIYTMSPQPDGKIVVAGHSINPDAPFVKEVVRLNPDGTFDPTFNPNGSGANDKTEIVLRQPDGKLIIGGYFNRYNNNPVMNLARLNADGTFDPSFVVAVDSWVFNGVLQADGRLLICGGFQNVDGSPRSGVARVFTSDPPPPDDGGSGGGHTNVPASAGTFNGLFVDASSPQVASSGYISIKVTPKNAYTGRVLLAGTGSAFSGRFDSNGQALIKAPFRGGPLTGVLQFTGADRVEGTITNGTSVAPVLALRAPFGPTNRATIFAGKYTMVIPGSSDPVSGPGGSGIGLASVDAFGNARVSGTLGDGTAYVQQTPVAGDGQWPFFASLYGGKGVIIGWLDANQNLNGTVHWISPANPRAAVYKAGFTNQPTVLGSRYSFTNGTAILTPADNTAVLNATGSAFPLTDSIVWGANNVITVGPGNTNKLRLVVDRNTGAIQGSFVNPANRRSTLIRGVVLQNQNEALGWFPSTGETGGMELK